MCKESNAMLNDEYIIKAFIKQDRDVIIFGDSEDVETLRKINCTYNYALVLYENNVLECLKQAEQMFRQKPNNLDFNIDTIIINRNKLWQIRIGDEQNQDPVELKRVTQMHQEQITQQLCDLRCLTQCKKIFLSNCELLYQPFSEYFQKNKKKMKIESLKLHTYVFNTNINIDLANEGYCEALETALKSQQLKELILQRLYFDKRTIEFMKDYLQFGRSLQRLDISFDQENVKRGITNQDQLDLFFRIMADMPRLQKVKYEFMNTIGQLTYFSEEWNNYQCNLQELKLYNGDKMIQQIIQWLCLIPMNPNLKKFHIIDLSNKQKYHDSALYNLSNFISKHQLLEIVFQLVLSTEHHHDLFQICMHHETIKDFNIYRDKSIVQNLDFNFTKQFSKEKLILNGNDIYSEQFCQTLDNFCQDKSNCQISTIRINSKMSEQIEQMLPTLKDVNKFEAYHCQVNFKLFKVFNNLQYLELFWAEMDATKIMNLISFFISDQNKLTHFSMSSANFVLQEEEIHILDDFVQSLECLKSVKELSFQLCKFNIIKDQTGLAKTLSKLNSLEKLKLDYCYLTDSFLIEFSKLIQEPKLYQKLSYLQISYHNYEDIEVVSNYLKAVAHNKTIREFVSRQLLPQFLQSDQAIVKRLEQSAQYLLDYNKKIFFIDLTRSYLRKISNKYPWRAIYY
ncbi:UNKNOWN [Stylonychia lemnae]|uniref:Uncharacterized protein n=1 Tax=Stylonychia lemnae TaxID=5949 RepID=A0A078AJH2_STYLE|nr:UNKNOWN [Stylonychia lemnae]|eukprot:CDW81637.1 UNKNOWN [Stylonychia lemnae]